MDDVGPPTRPSIGAAREGAKAHVARIAMCEGLGAEHVGLADLHDDGVSAAPLRRHNRGYPTRGQLELIDR